MSRKKIAIYIGIIILAIAATFVLPAVIRTGSDFIAGRIRGFVETESESGTETESGTDTESESETETVSETETETESVAISEIESETATETSAVTETETVSVTETQSETAKETAKETAPATEPGTSADTTQETEVQTAEENAGGSAVSDGSSDFTDKKGTSDTVTPFGSNTAAETRASESSAELIAARESEEQRLLAYIESFQPEIIELDTAKGGYNALVGGRKDKLLEAYASYFCGNYEDDIDVEKIEIIEEISDTDTDVTYQTRAYERGTDESLIFICQYSKKYDFYSVYVQKNF